MSLIEYANLLLNGPSITDKLQREKKSIAIELGYKGGEIPLSPGRDKKLSFSDKQVKFPKKGSLSQEENRAKALHFFANHELLAIEMMAAAIVKFPTLTEEDVAFKKTLLSTISDEQKHFELYRSRMEEFGIGFGDIPLNDFFWRQISKVEYKEQFYALVALVFEQANLDFAGYYKTIFENVGDEKSANIMSIVYEDEIKHVSLGVKWLNNWRGEDSLWDYYRNNLPELITPSRAKGIVFDEEARVRAGLDKEFIEEMKNYSEEFRVTNRKEW